MAKIFFDAATKGNPGVSAGAVIIITEKERIIETTSLGYLDNHSAEWATFVYALELAKYHDVRNALIFTDSKLIEDTMNSRELNNQKFQSYYLKVKQLATSFDLLFVKWEPRKKNKEANHHAQQALYQLTK
ncbi:ribonuclease HI family protein [Staphylococcus sp. SQ8-PEA]|uniref:Ribonuclease HI family protein n=1 Tax=Staphylococcus marylandisciuri TaxID=2981529 RepID=A0ABT2QNF1_9STAP|nr:ribonuclease HI family protein [Staphylococcus marylandisciuri]MCU5745510.1 ribonuclease HI family protein [Staphylococcus marylandisciuri]